MPAHVVTFKTFFDTSGIYRTVKNQGAWLYSDGTFVTEDSVTLSVGWHLVTRPWTSFTHLDWDPANGAPPTDPPPPTITEWVKAYDGIVPAIAPGSPTLSPTDLSTVNPSPVTARAGWTYTGAVDTEWQVVAYFYMDGVLVDTKSVYYNSTVTTLESDAVFYKGNQMYVILKYQSQAGLGPAAQSATTTYPGHT